MSVSYRAVAMYMDAEISEGFGTTKREAILDATRQVGGMYPPEDVTVRLYTEQME